MDRHYIKNMKVNISRKETLWGFIIIIDFFIKLGISNILKQRLKICWSKFRFLMSWLGSIFCIIRESITINCLNRVKLTDPTCSASER